MSPLPGAVAVPPFASVGAASSYLAGSGPEQQPGLGAVGAGTGRLPRLSRPPGLAASASLAAEREPLRTGGLRLTSHADLGT